MKTPNSYKLRPIYLERIKPYVSKNLIKVLVGQRRVGKSFLLFQLMDIGLRHALLGYRTADIGKILENIVYLHLVIAGYQVRIGKFQNKEIDFVCTRGDEKMYVQVAYLIADEVASKREFGNLELIYDNYPKFVVSLDENATGNVGGIRHVHVREFIKKLI